MSLPLHPRYYKGRPSDVPSLEHLQEKVRMYAEYRNDNERYRWPDQAVASPVYLAKERDVTYRTKALVSSIIGWTVGAGVVALFTWLIVWASFNWHRGIYAGFHYNGARQYVTEVMADNYGLAATRQMHLGVPDVVNKHSRALLTAGSDQVREFHLVGPRGVKYCVQVWGGGTDWNTDYSIKKGCEF